jgi:hypothetical protein
MRIFIFIGLGLCTLLVQSCLNVVPYDLPPAPRRLTVNGLFSPQHPLRVQVSRSLPADTLIVFQPELDAEVSLWQGGSRLAVMDSIFTEGGFSYFTASQAPTLEPSVPYTLQVIAHSGDTAVATDVIPAAPEARSIEVSEISITSTERQIVRNGDTLSFPRYSISAILAIEIEPSDLARFYGVRAYVASDFYLESFSIDSEPIDTLFEVQLQAFLGPLSRGVRESFQSYPFENDQVWAVDSGQRATILVEASTNVTMQRDTPPPDSLRLELWAFSPAYYQYQVDYTKQEALGQDPFAQPVNVPGNVEGGYGIWGGYQVKSITLALE